MHDMLRLLLCLKRSVARLLCRFLVYNYISSVYDGRNGVWIGICFIFWDSCERDLKFMTMMYDCIESVYDSVLTSQIMLTYAVVMYL